MGINNGVVVPGLRVQAIEVDFSCRQDGVRAFAINHVATNIQILRELVVLTELLQLGKSIGNQSRVNDANVGRCFCIGSKRTRGSVGRSLVGDLHHIRDAIGVSRGFNVSLDVIRFECPCAGVDLETLDDGGISQTQHETRDDVQGGSNHGQAPAADDRRDEEEKRHHNRNTRHDCPGGDRGRRLGETSTKC